MKSETPMVMAACCGLSFFVGIMFGERGAKVDRAAARVCKAQLHDTLDFIGLVVDDVEESIDRAGVVVSGSSVLIESMHARARSAPIPRSVDVERRLVAGDKYGVNDFQTACVGSGVEAKCYVQIDGLWKTMEAEP